VVVISFYLKVENKLRNVDASPAEKMDIRINLQEELLSQRQP
jgi:hypothetical protein